MSDYLESDQILQRDISRLQLELTAAKAEIERLRDQNNCFIEANKDLVEESSRLMDENEALRGRAEQAEARVAELERADNVPEVTDEIVQAATKAVRQNLGKTYVAVASHVINAIWPFIFSPYEKAQEARILLNQAEAIEEMCGQWKEEAHWIINESHSNYQRHYAKAGFQYAQRLRTQAEAADKGDDDDQP